MPFGALNTFDYLTPFLLFKISFLVMMLANLRHLISAFFGVKRENVPLLLYFVIYSFVSFFNVRISNPDEFQDISVYFGFFDLFMFLNLLSYLVIQQNIKSNICFPNIYLKAFVFSGLVLSLCFFADSFVEFDQFGRMTLFGDNSNAIGSHLAISIVITGHFLKKSRLFIFKFLLGVVIIVSFLGILKTGSRSALLSSFAVFINFINFEQGFVKRSMRIVLLGLIFFLLIKLISTQEVMFDRMIDFIDDGDVSGRDLFVLSLLPYAIDHWIMGVGISGYYNVTIQHFGGFFSPHNSLLEVFIYTGVVGLFFFSRWMFSVVKRCFIIKKELSLDLFVSLSVIMLIVLFNSQFFLFKPIWVVTAIILSVDRNSINA